jgi:methionyl-tRNA formyltransferase
MSSPSLRIIFAGTPEFAAQHLAALYGAGHQLVGVLTQPDRASGRGKQLGSSSVKRLALQYGLPLWQPITLRSTTLQQQLAALQADLMVVVAYGLILPSTLLTLPRLGCLNVHASLLPRWRGAAPIQRAILAGDACSGITLMQMDAGLDSGPILHQISCPITDQTTSAALLQQLATLGASALVEILPLLAHGQVVAQLQEHSGITYAAKISKQEGALDWNRPAAELARAVRAFNPWPLTYFEVAGEPIKVWQATAVPLPVAAAPRTVIAADQQGIQVATAEGSLLLQRLQLAGKRPISAHDLFNAHHQWFTVGSPLT